jgi:DNA mismatch endonuclease, patch repair protein
MLWALCMKNGFQKQRKQSSSASSVSRSQLMKAIRRQNTNPEMITRKIIHAAGFRYRLHSKKLPGTPDIVFSGRKKIIFVNGCFWHRHANCRKASMPKTNIEFWSSKFQENISRDRLKNAQLRRAGYKVLVVWECETKFPDQLRDKVCHFLSDGVS